MTFVIVPTASGLPIIVGRKPEYVKRFVAATGTSYSVSRIRSSVPGPPLDHCFFLCQVANPFVDVGVN